MSTGKCSNITTDGCVGMQLSKNPTKRWFKDRETNDAHEYIDFLLSQLTWDMEMKFKEVNLNQENPNKVTANKMKASFQTVQQRNATCKVCGEETVAAKEGKWVLDFSVVAKT